MLAIDDLATYSCIQIALSPNIQAIVSFVNLATYSCIQIAFCRCFGQVGCIRTRNLLMYTDRIFKIYKNRLDTWVKYVSFKPCRVYLPLYKYSLTYTFSAYGHRVARKSGAEVPQIHVSFISALN